MSDHTKTNTLARIENHFLFNARHGLNAREQKVILFLISNINPLDRDFEIQTVSLKEIHDIVMEKRSGSFYEQMIEFQNKISKAQITFDTSVKMRGKKVEGVINWFSSIIPKYDDKGDICLKFRFSPDLKPYLLELKQYTQIDYQQVLPLKSGFAARIYQVFRAYRDKMAKHQRKSIINYELQELRELLGVGDKYTDWRNFKKRVLDMIETEIQQTDIRVNIIPTRKKGRKVTGVKFEIWDKGTKTKSSKSGKLTFDDLSFAQRKAYTQLDGYGIDEGVAIEMLSRVGGSEINGFEDWYFEEVISIFESKTKQEGEAAKAGTLVNWFLKKKIFEQGDMFAKIMEQIQTRKKKLQQKRPSAWENRLLAKDLASEEFSRKYHQKRNKTK